MTKSFQQTQFAFTRYLRNPGVESLPDDIQPERMQVYVELIYNNIEGFISGAFPVLRSIIPDQKWHGLVRDFIKTHSAQTPYFLQISQEFLAYLLQNSHSLVKDFPFMIALAHYEWVELALDVADDEIPQPSSWPEENIFLSYLSLSPLATVLSYPWPVQKLSPSFQAEEAETHLLVYRNFQDQVQFIELNPYSSRLLQLCRDNPQSTLRQQVNQLHREMGKNLLSDEQIVLFCRQLHQLGITFFSLTSK